MTAAPTRRQIAGMPDADLRALAAQAPRTAAEAQRQAAAWQRAAVFARREVVERLKGKRDAFTKNQVAP